MLTQDLSLTRSLLTGTTMMMTFEEDPSLTKSLLTGLQTGITTTMTSKEITVTRKDTGRPLGHLYSRLAQDPKPMTTFMSSHLMISLPI